MASEVLHEPKRFFVSEFHVAREEERVWQAIEVLRKGQQLPQPRGSHPVHHPRNTSQVWAEGPDTGGLYARVSTDKQEREETVASQVALLQQTAEARGYDVLPGNVFIDDGVSGTRLDRPAWNSYAISRPKAPLTSCW